MSSNLEGIVLAIGGGLLETKIGLSSELCLMRWWRLMSEKENDEEVDEILAVEIDFSHCSIMISTRPFDIAHNREI